MATILHGNNLDILPTFDDCSIDAIVTDPPYELGFMGKRWDASGIAYNTTLWQECLRVLKPGGHLLAFGGTRTYHRMACAIEDAGFEIRDSIHWLYGSGFPKSLDVSKAIDKQAGAEREVIGTTRGVAVASSDNQYGGINRGAVGIKQTGVDIPVTAPATEQAKQWAGWGTALKPAHEPIVVARKPLVGTVAANVLEYGTGAINIDATRIGFQDGEYDPTRIQRQQHSSGAIEGAFGASALIGKEIQTYKEGGRWPANVMLTHTDTCDDECVPGCPVSLLDKQSGFSKDGVAVRRNSSGNTFGGSKPKPAMDDMSYGGAGGASRFFYCAKPSRKERNAGLDHLEQKTAGEATDRKDGTAGLESPRAGAGRTGGAQNLHPTVKPLALMRYLVRLVTPTSGTVLDPFAGSGTTLMAAILEGFNAIGIEMTDEYLPIIQGRIAWAEKEKMNQPPVLDQLEFPL